MSINLKVAATLALGVASLFGAGQANAAVCDAAVMHAARGRTVQCYYLPTVSNGRVTGLQKEVSYSGGYPYGQTYGRPGAVIGGGGGAWGHHGR